MSSRVSALVVSHPHMHRLGAGQAADLKKKTVRSRGADGAGGDTGLGAA